jgi:hypothetical protein
MQKGFDIKIDSSRDYKKYTNFINCKVCRKSVVEKTIVLFILQYQIIGLIVWYCLLTGMERPYCPK